MGMITLLFMIAVGLFLNNWLRKSYPCSVHPIVTGIALPTFLALVHLTKDTDATPSIPNEQNLAVASIAFGFVLGEAITLSLVSIYTPSRPIQPTDAMHQALADIIKGGESNQHNGYQARAFPNRRLEVAFRVNNCFTAMEKKRCDDVRTEVLQLLQPAKSENMNRWRDWPELVEVARTVARAELSNSKDKVNLFAAMQMIVMKTMLKVLFDIAPEATDKDEQIRKLATDVNRQWQASKGGLVLGEAPEWDFEQEASMKATAEEIFGPWDDDNENNPFNKILPGYETMWRVVLRCFLELSSSRHPSAGTEAWKERLALFIANPTKEQLQKESNDAGLTAEHVSFEILRLYPPTRHVAREQKDIETGAVRPLTADIEEMHHTAPIWGNDPKSFRPERWIDLTEGVNTRGFMPFGETPFRCPARQTQGGYMPFGVTMIAVLTGCFIEAMADKWRLDGQEIPSASRPMGNGRDDYDRVALLRIKPDGADLASNFDDEPATTATEETEAEKTEAETTEAETTEVEKTEAEKTEAEKTEAEKTDAEKTDAEKTDANSTATDDTYVNANGEETDDDKIDDDKTDDDKTDDDKTGDDKAGDDKTGDDRTEGDKTDGDKTDGDKTDGDKTDGDKTDGDAKTELSETNGSDGEEDEKQTDAAQQ